MPHIFETRSFTYSSAVRGVTLQFVTQKGFGSWFIRYLTFSKYSHVDIVLPDGRLLGSRLDGGVQVREPNYDPFTNVDRYFYPCDRPDEVYNFARQQIGKPYDSVGILNFFLQRAHYWRQMDSWFCSELAAAAFAFSGQPVLNLDDCDRVTPRDLTVSIKAIKLQQVGGVWVMPKAAAAGA